MANRDTRRASRETRRVRGCGCGSERNVRFGRERAAAQGTSARAAKIVWMQRSSPDDRDDLAARLDAASTRLKAAAAVSAGDPPPAPEPAAQRLADPTADRLGAAIDGLSLAEVRVRHARAQLAELESRLGWTVRASRAS